MSRTPRLAARQRLRRAAAPTALALIAVSALRETGHLDLSLHRSEQNASITSSATIHTGGDNAAQAEAGPPRTRNGTTFVVSVAPEAAATAGPGLVEQVRRGLEARLGSVPVDAAWVEEAPIRVEVRRLALSGPYRVPLFKSGTCRFTVVAQSGDQNPRDAGRVGRFYRGEVSGEIDSRVVGLYSAYQFRRTAAEKVAEEVAKAVSGHIGPKG